jgi:hypothetical protein
MLCSMWTLARKWGKTLWFHLGLMYQPLMTEEYRALAEWLMVGQNPSAWRITWYRDMPVHHESHMIEPAHQWWLVTRAMAYPGQSLPLTKRSHFGRMLSVLFLISTLRLYRETPVSVSRLSSNKPIWKKCTRFKHSPRDVQTLICSYAGCTILNRTQTIIM